MSGAEDGEWQLGGPNVRRPDFGLKIWGYRIAGVLMLSAAWEMAADAGVLNLLFFGVPSGILQFAWNGLFIERFLLVDTYFTIQATLLAFGLGSATGVLAGLLFVAYPAVEEFFEPFTAALNALPRIALAPLFLLWFGLGLAFKVALGTSLSFFILLSSTIAGARSVNPDHLVLLRTLGANRLQFFIIVVLPGAVPTVFSGLRLGLIYSLLGVVTAELLASRAGLGQRISFLAGTFNTNGVFAVLLVLAVIGGLLSGAMNFLERWLLRWR